MGRKAGNLRFGYSDYGTLQNRSLHPRGAGPVEVLGEAVPGPDRGVNPETVAQAGESAGAERPRDGSISQFSVSTGADYGSLLNRKSRPPNVR
jgi:hypothetical protein